MAKGQKRSNREAKKPKASKKNVARPSTPIADAFAKPKPGTAATTVAKK